MCSHSAYAFILVLVFLILNPFSDNDVNSQHDVVVACCDKIWYIS